MTATYRLNKNLALGAELSQTMAMDAFNGVVDHKAPLDGRTNLSVGVTYYLNKRGKDNRQLWLLSSTTIV